MIADPVIEQTPTGFRVTVSVDPGDEQAADEPDAADTSGDIVASAIGAAAGAAAAVVKNVLGAIVDAVEPVESPPAAEDSDEP